MQALKIFGRCLAASRSLLHPYHPDVAYVLAWIANAHALLGNSALSASAREEHDSIARRSQLNCAGPACARSTREDGGALNVCAGCSRTHYCSENCQAADWSAGHKADCKAIAAIVKAAAGK